MEINRLELEELNKSWGQKMEEANAKEIADAKKEAEEKEAKESGRP